LAFSFQVENVVGASGPGMFYAFCMPRASSGLPTYGNARRSLSPCVAHRGRGESVECTGEKQYIRLDFYSPLFKVVDFVLLAPAHAADVSAVERKPIASHAHTPSAPFLRTAARLMTGNSDPQVVSGQSSFSCSRRDAPI
jgi:hypothetical protein